MLVSLLEETLRKRPFLPSPSTSRWRHTEKMAVYESERVFSRNGSADTSSWDFPAFTTVRNKFV